MKLVFVLVVMTACKSSREYVDVPGWSCTWEDDVCSCTPARDGVAATHTGCSLPKYEYCVTVEGMGTGRALCECRTAGPGKLQPNEHRVTQCPPR